MRFYYHPLSLFSRKVLLALHEKRLRFQPIVVDPGAPGQGEVYREQVNPLGRVPYLIADDGWAMPESTTIVEYLDQRWPGEVPLIPLDPEQARVVRFLDRVADLYLLTPLNALQRERQRHPLQFDQDAVDRLLEELRRSLVLLERSQGEGPWLLGGDFSLADISCSIAVELLARGGWSLSQLPKTEAWLQRVLKRPSWRQVQGELALF